LPLAINNFLLVLSLIFIVYCFILLIILAVLNNKLILIQFFLSRSSFDLFVERSTLLNLIHHLLKLCIIIDFNLPSSIVIFMNLLFLQLLFLLILLSPTVHRQVTVFVTH